MSTNVIFNRKVRKDFRKERKAQIEVCGVRRTVCGLRQPFERLQIYLF
jgi:hypothetical protein